MAGALRCAYPSAANPLKLHHPSGGDEVHICSTDAAHPQITRPTVADGVLGFTLLLVTQPQQQSGTSAFQTNGAQITVVIHRRRCIQTAGRIRFRRRAAHKTVRGGQVGSAHITQLQTQQRVDSMPTINAEGSCHRVVGVNDIPYFVRNDLRFFVNVGVRMCQSCFNTQVSVLGLRGACGCRHQGQYPVKVFFHKVIQVADVKMPTQMGRH